jgi:hypothetical protein
MTTLSDVERLHDLRAVELIAPDTSDLLSWTRAQDEFNALSRQMIDSGELIELVETCGFERRIRNLYF